MAAEARKVYILVSARLMAADARKVSKLVSSWLMAAEVRTRSTVVVFSGLTLRYTSPSRICQN
jgi:hypothetical protein